MKFGDKSLQQLWSLKQNKKGQYRRWMDRSVAAEATARRIHEELEEIQEEIYRRSIVKARTHG